MTPHVKKDAAKTRRQFLQLTAPLALLLAAPAYAVDLFQILDPEGKNEDVQKARQAVEGLTSIAQSAAGIDYETERAIGESLALEGFQRYGLPVADEAFQQYVNRLGRAVARNALRPSIPYYFVVLRSPLYNAFSCPGGIIFLSSRLVASMRDEAELACVLAHEIGHVSHKHALQSIRRAKFLEGLGKIGTINMEGEKGEKYRAMIGDLQTVLFDRGLDKAMEFEADLSGMEGAYRTGYDPAGMIRVLEMLKANRDEATIKGSWFSTHPPLETRLARLRKQLGQYPDASSLATVKDRFLKFRKHL
jgi:predicted Zn-dependent protease